MASWTRCLVLMLLFVGCVGCGGATEADNAVVDPCEELPWNFANTGEPFVLNWCTSCHHSEILDDERLPGTAGVNFDTYDDVFARLERVEARALISRTMPPAGGVAEEDIARFQEWVDCGAPRD